MSYSDGVYFLSTTDPYWNLAFEKYLAERVSKALLFWTNRPSVILGRSQNPWRECSVGLLESKGINLVRRYSGGGCVYHDAGNLNFTFIRKGRQLATQENLQLIIDVLQRLTGSYDREIVVNARNDLLLHGKKFSGQAFRVLKNSHYHHGTLLIDANLSHLKGALSMEDKYVGVRWKGVPSNRSKVVNLKEVFRDFRAEDFQKELAETFFPQRDCMKVYRVNLEDYRSILEVKENHAHLINPKWVYEQIKPVFEYSQSKMIGKKSCEYLASGLF